MSGRKVPEVEELFRNKVVSNIKNSFIDNINFTNGHCWKMSASELIEYVKRQASHILEDIYRTEHLILDNGVKELQHDLRESYKDIVEAYEAFYLDSTAGECCFCREADGEHMESCTVLKAEEWLKENKIEKP